MCALWVGLKMQKTLAFANFSISLSKMAFLAVFHGGFYPPCTHSRLRTES